VTRYEPRNLDAMRRLIVGFPDDMKVEVGPNVPDPLATAKTVAELHSDSLRRGTDIADLMDGFEGSLKPSRNNSPETNRNHAETSLKPSETKVAGQTRNRETAP
jgi:hypothetical protein